LLRRHYADWVYSVVKITKDYNVEAYLADLHKDAEIVIIVRRGAILVASKDAPIKPELDDKVLSYAPAPHEQTSPADDEAPEPEKIDDAENADTVAEPSDAALTPATKQS
ncbi:MAG: hypothetical protein AAGJ87_12895, partial [Pseudomonadota bacterium]